MIKKLKKVTLLDIKNNLAVILLFPALLGGLWQLLELSKMSISFIRFFSPTQLLPDGLLILFIFGMIYLPIQLGLLDRKINLKRKVLKVSETKPSLFVDYYTRPLFLNKLVFIDNPIYRIGSIWIHILQLFLGLSIMVLVVIVLNYFNEEFNFATFILFLILFISIGKIIVQSIVVLAVLFMESKYNRIKEYFLDKPILKEISLFPLKIFLIFSIFFVFLLLPLKIVTFFHKEYMLPENLKNLDYISDTLKDNNYTSNSISYFNDKYIFIEHVKEDKNTTIEILKFDQLFKSK